MKRIALFVLTNLAILVVLGVVSREAGPAAGSART